MSYPGNPSLAQDVQERISNTFQQTLDLVTSQKDQEALVGCEFILRMDPEYQPAKTLVARLKSGERPVAIDDLRAPPSLDVDLGDLDDLEDLGSLDDFDDLTDPSLDDDAGAPAAAAPASGLTAVISDLLARRNFEQILQIAEKQQQSVEGDPEVKALVETARGLSESETYVQAFLKSARKAQAEGRPADVESYLKKASTLDPEHPDVLGFAAGPTPAQAPAQAAAPPPALAADDDLLALQQQSLSLDAAEDGDPATDLAEELGRDPRQTKPIAAVPLDDGGSAAVAVGPQDPAADANEPDFEAALFAGEGEAGELEDLDAELFDGQGLSEPGAGDPEPAAPIPVVAGDALADLDAELFDGQETSEDLGPELVLDDATPEDAGAAGGDQAAEGGGDRVGQLLEEGQTAFDGGDYQAAIDVWSRIFLIDIDNQEASRRIEEARGKKAEIERQAEELFHEAVGQIEDGSIDEAKSTLARVLELAPSHSLAREYAEQLDAGQVPVTGDLDVATTADIAADLDTSADAGAGSASMEAAVARDRVVVVKRTDRRIIALGAAVLVAVIGGGAFLKLKWDDWFPNQEAPPTAQQVRKVDPIERATKMHEGGNTENAILLLERIQPQDPVYEDAQALIAQWKALVEAPPEAENTGPSEEQIRRHALLVAAARKAHQQGRHIRTLKYFERASKVLPLGAEDQTLKRESEVQLEPLNEQLAAFANGQYATIIPVLWRKRESDPGNLDLQRLLVDSYYNLALTDLQRGNVQAAAKKLREALEAQPENQELQRLQLFTQTYTQRRQDLLYRIFVKYLPSR